MYRRYLVYMSDVKQVAGGISSPHSELISVLCDDLEGFDQGAGGGFPREGVCVCVCVCVCVYGQFTVVQQKRMHCKAILMDYFSCIYNLLFWLLPWPKISSPSFSAFKYATYSAICS